MIPRFSPDYRWSDFFSRTPRNIDQLLVDEMKKQSNLDHHFFFKYGRSGLFFLLKALGIQGKKIVMPSYSCVVVAHAIVKSGNTPVFLDSDPPSFQPRPERYFEAIDDETAMIIPTHLFGYPEETSKLYRDVKSKFPDVFVLQDCAHSYFCKDSTGKVVTEYGDGAIFGANISKLVNGVHAGILSLRSEDHAKKVSIYLEEDPLSPPRGLREFIYAALAGIAFQPQLYGLVYFLKEKTSLLDSEVKYFDEEKIELPSDFDEELSQFSKKILLNSLKRFEERVAKRRKIAQSYDEILYPLMKEEKLTYLRPHPGATWSHFPVFLKLAQRDMIRKKIQSVLRAEIGIIVDYSVSDMGVYWAMFSMSSKNSLHFSKSVINLPLVKTVDSERLLEIDYAP